MEMTVVRDEDEIGRTARKLGPGARICLCKADPVPFIVPGIAVVDHQQDEGYVTPAEAAGEDAVYVSRIRQDPSVKHGISFWCVSDNLRKGAALNSVQIAETLIASYLSKAA